MRVLILDDDKIFVTGVKRNLQNYGHEVSAAYKVKEIKTAVESAGRFDAVVIDLMMRKIPEFQLQGEKYTGIEIVKHLLDKKIDGKLIVLTGVDVNKLDFDFKGNGVFFISKPMRQGSLELLEYLKGL